MLSASSVCVVSTCCSVETGRLAWLSFIAPTSCCVSNLLTSFSHNPFLTTHPFIHPTVLLLHRATRNGVHQHGMLRAAEVSQQLCRKLKRLGLKTDSSCEGDVDQVCVCVCTADGCVCICVCVCVCICASCVVVRGAVCVNRRVSAHTSIILCTSCLTRQPPTILAALYTLTHTCLHRLSRPSQPGCL